MINADHLLTGVLAVIEQRPGSYRYLCAVGDEIVFTHQPHGAVLHTYRNRGGRNGDPYSR
jgi:hypothetical protein